MARPLSSWMRYSPLSTKQPWQRCALLKLCPSCRRPEMKSKTNILQQALRQGGGHPQSEDAEGAHTAPAARRRNGGYGRRNARVKRISRSGSMSPIIAVCCWCRPPPVRTNSSYLPKPLTIFSPSITRRRSATASPQSHMWECGISHLSEICTTASWPWLCQHEGMVSELSLHCQRIAQAEPIGGTAPNQVAMATNPRRLIP